MNIEKLESFFGSDASDADKIFLALQEIHSVICPNFNELSLCIHRINMLNYGAPFLTKDVANGMILDLVKLVPVENDKLVTRFCWLVINFLNKQTIILENDVEQVADFLLKAISTIPFSISNLPTTVLYLRAFATVLFGNVQRLENIHNRIIESLQQTSTLASLTFSGCSDKSGQDDLNELSFICAIVQCYENLSAENEEIFKSYLSADNQRAIARHLLYILQMLQNMTCFQEILYYKTVKSCFKSLRNIMEVSHTFPNDLVGNLVTIVQVFSIIGHFETPKSQDLQETSLTKLTLGNSTATELKVERSTEVGEASASSSLLDSCSAATVHYNLPSPRHNQHYEASSNLPSSQQKKNQKNKRKSKKIKGNLNASKEFDSDYEEEYSSPNFKVIPPKPIVETVDAEEEKFWSSFGVSDSSDVELNQSFTVSSGSNHLAKIRVQALTLFHNAVKCINRKTMFGFWSSIIPERFISQANQLRNFPLFAIIIRDPSHKMRLAALSILTSILEGSKQFLMAAEDGDQYHNVAYTPFSVNLGNMVKELHRCLLLTLTKEQVSIVLVQSVKCLGMLVASSPYHRLKPGLLSRTVKIVRHFLSHKDANVKVVALTCLGRVVSVHAPLAEVIHLLQNKPSNLSFSSTSGFFHPRGKPGESSSDVGKRESGFSSGHDEFDVKISLSSGVSTVSNSEPGTPRKNQPDSVLPMEDTPSQAFASNHKCDSGSGSTTTVASSTNESASNFHRSSEIAWLVKACVDIVMSGCNARKNRKILTPSSLGPYLDTDMSELPSEPSSYVHVIPVRVEALQLLTLLSQNYFAVIRPHLGVMQDVAGSCLHNDPDYSIQLHTVKLLEAVTSSVLLGQSPNAVNYVPFDQAVKLWNFILGGPIQKALSNNVDSMVEMVACECLGNIGPEVFPILPLKDTQFIKTIMLGFASVTSHHICTGALSAIGRSVTYPCMSDDPFFLADASNAVIRALKTNNLSVITKAAWVLSNLSDAFVLNRLNEEFVSNISESLLLKLLESSIDLCNAHEKPRSNALRTIGNLLNYLPPSYLDTGKFDDIIKNCFLVIIKHIPNGSVKVRWNACYAFGNIMWNEPKDAYSALVKAVKTCKNFKVRISAATVLAIPSRREMFFQGEESKTSSKVWSSLTSHKKFVADRTESENRMSSVHYYRFTVKDTLELMHCVHPGQYMMKVDVETEYGMMQSEESKKVGCIEDCFAVVWSGILSALLECDSTSADFADIKYRNTLVSRLINTLLHLLSLVVPADLDLCYQSLRGNEEKVKDYLLKQGEENQLMTNEVDNHPIKIDENIMKTAKHFSELSNCGRLTSQQKTSLKILSEVFLQTSQNSTTQAEAPSAPAGSRFCQIYD